MINTEPGRRIRPIGRIGAVARDRRSSVRERWDGGSGTSVRSAAMRKCCPGWTRCGRRLGQPGEFHHLLTTGWTRPRVGTRVPVPATNVLTCVCGRVERAGPVLWVVSIAGLVV